MGSEFWQLLPFTKRRAGERENAVLAILWKCIFDTMSTQIFPDVALLIKQKNISRLCSTAVVCLKGCSSPHKVRGFSFLAVKLEQIFSTERKHRHVYIIQLDKTSCRLMH